MTLKDQITADFKDAFLNTDEFAEDITYTPKGGNPKSIKAIVTRQRLNTEPYDRGRILHKQVELYIANDATAGVTSVDKGDDTVSLPATPGGSNVTWVIDDILGASDSVWHLLASQ